MTIELNDENELHEKSYTTHTYSYILTYGIVPLYRLRDILWGTGTPERWDERGQPPTYR